MTDVLIPTDPHAVNPLMGPNIPEGMFQSRTLEIVGQDPRAQALYDWAIQARSESKLANATEQMLPVGPPRDESKILEDFFSYLVEQSDIVEFITTHVVPEAHGTIGPELREEITRLLSDPKGDQTKWPTWPYTSISVALQTTPDTDGRQGGMHLDILDGEGVLRLGCSRELPSVMHDGWYINQDGVPTPVSVPVLDDSGLPTGELTGELMGEGHQPDPGTWYAWSSLKGVHQRPLTDKKGLDEVGGERSFVTMSVNINELVRQAKQNIAERGISTPVEIRGAGTQPVNIQNSTTNLGFGR